MYKHKYMDHWTTIENIVCESIRGLNKINWGNFPLQNNTCHNKYIFEDEKKKSMIFPWYVQNHGLQVKFLDFDKIQWYFHDSSREPNFNDFSRSVGTLLKLWPSRRGYGYVLSVASSIPGRVAAIRTLQMVASMGTHSSRRRDLPGCYIG